MHVLMGLLAAIGLVAGILWRIRMASEGAREIVGTARDARSAVRKWGWQRKFNRSMLNDITDPREAASAMMVAVAQEDGAMTETESKLIQRLIRAHFQVDEAEAGELFAFGRFLAQDVGDLGEYLRRLSKPIVRVCSHKEQSDLVTMLHAVGSADGAIDHVVEHAVLRLRDKLAV